MLCALTFNRENGKLHTSYYCCVDITLILVFLFTLSLRQTVVVLHSEHSREDENCDTKKLETFVSLMCSRYRSIRLYD